MPNNKATRTANGSGSIRKRADGRWEGRYSVGFDPATGKQIQRSVYGKTQKAVRQQISRITNEIDEKTYVAPCAMTLNEWLGIWLEDYTIGLKDSTAFNYERSMDLYVRPALGNVRLDHLDGRMIQHLYNSLRKERDGKKPLSAKTIKDVHGKLHCILQQAVRLSYIRTNPSDNCVPPRVFKKEVKPLTDEQMNKLLAAIQDSRYRIMIIVFMFTGLREAEALGLTWDCVDFHNGTILINKQLQRRPQSAGGTQLTPTKNGKSRVLRPARYVMQTLKQRYTEQVMQCMRAGDDWQAWHNEAEHKKALVFTNEDGRYLVAKRLYLHFKKLAEEAGAPDARVHDLRHTFAVISLQNGDDVKTVQTNLGHASASFTLDVYGHVSDRMQRESADRMQQYINEISRTKNA